MRMGQPAYQRSLEQGAKATKFRGLMSCPFISHQNQLNSKFAGHRTQQPYLSPNSCTGASGDSSELGAQALSNILLTWKPEKQVKPKAHPGLSPFALFLAALPGPVIVTDVRDAQSTGYAQALPPPGHSARPHLLLQTLWQLRLNSWQPQDALHFGLGYFLEVGMVLCTKVSSFFNM